MTNLISVSSAPIAKLEDKKYYDLSGTLKVMKKVFRESVVDGFELQLEPEWDSENPPLTDAQYADWTKTPKYTSGEILTMVKRGGPPILSAHANRDIGNYLCSDRESDVEKGKRVMYEALSLADGLGAEVCVFHLWNTRKKRLNLSHLRDVFCNTAAQFPRVKAAVENIPTHSEGHTPFSLVRLFDYITLDLRWAVMYRELNAFESTIDRVVNVHLRGRLERDRWVLDGSGISFYEALDRIRNEWDYSGLLTLEPEGGIQSSSFGNFVEAMRSLRT